MQGSNFLQRAAMSNKLMGDLELYAAVVYPLHLLQWTIRCLSSGVCTCMEQFAVIRQECAVADVVPSWSEDCSFSVVVRSSL